MVLVPRPEKPLMRRRLIIDVSVEDVPANREVDLLDVTMDAVLDALEGFPAVDGTEEHPCARCGAHIEPERFDDDGEPWDAYCGSCAHMMAGPD